ncbi:InlB B-repeat-containing protein [Streptomyces pseudovenezuelae]|uniref:InlB B-repeat-containing protein n=1 Tax=Streptomyces pseudovenezuelae TaxID=67350 RepID=UPI0036E61D0B
MPHRPVGSAPGFRLTGWKLDGKVLGTTEQTVSIPMTGDRTVVAEFSHGSAG